MSKQQATVTAKLHNLFAKAGGANVVSVNFARDIAKAHRLNETSAEIALYHFRMEAGVYKRGAAPLAH